jgi:hypothetical protein
VKSARHRQLGAGRADDAGAAKKKNFHVWSDLFSIIICLWSHYSIEMIAVLIKRERTFAIGRASVAGGTHVRMSRWRLSQRPVPANLISLAAQK